MGLGSKWSISEVLFIYYPLVEREPDMFPSVSVVNPFEVIANWTRHIPVLFYHLFTEFLGHKVW